MTQQVPPLPSKPLKIFLIVGILLLIASLFLLYFASIIPIDYVTATTYENEANLAYPVTNPEQSGYWTYEYKVTSVTLQLGEFLTVSYPKNAHINGTVQIEIVWGKPNGMILYVSGPDYSYLTYQAHQLEFGSVIQNTIPIEVYLFGQYTQNMTLPITTVTSIHHYQTPQWVYLGVGIVCLPLAVCNTVLLC